MTEKHFKCTSCGGACTHTTTKLTMAGRDILVKGDELCDKCVEEKKRFWAEIARIDKTELLEMINSSLGKDN